MEVLKLHIFLHVLFNLGLVDLALEIIRVFVIDDANICVPGVESRIHVSLWAVKPLTLDCSSYLIRRRLAPRVIACLAPICNGDIDRLCYLLEGWNHFDNG